MNRCPTCNGPLRSGLATCRLTEKCERADGDLEAARKRGDDQ